MIVLYSCALLDDGPVKPEHVAVDVSDCYCNSSEVCVLVGLQHNNYTTILN